MRRRAVVVAALFLVGGLFLGTGAIGANPSGDAEGAFVARIADERAAAGGLAGYAVAADLVDVARQHAEEMRRQQRLHHNPSLGEDVQGWQAVGENVGVGPSVEEIHQKLMASPSHRDNILSGRFTEVGVGVVVDADGSTLWIVQVFRLPQSSAPPPSAPAESAPQSPPAESAASEPAPEPRPAPAPSSGGSAGTGTVRARAAGTGPGAPTTSAAPAPSTAVSTPSTLAPPATEVPPSPVEASPSPSADGSNAGATESAPATAGWSASGAPTGIDPVTSGARRVTWPVALAATMLLGVVSALAVHVGEARVRSIAAGGGRRASLLDVWELALAR